MDNKHTVHVTYNDGSNPFVMINKDKETILKELNFQLYNNIDCIKEITIF